MKRILVVLGSCFWAAMLFAGAADANVTGKWELTTSSQRGERTQVVQMTQDGEQLTVIMQGRQGGEIEAKGSVKGTAIEWSSTRESSRGTFTITYTGEIEGDGMKGKVQYGDFGSGDWTAKRVENTP